MEKGNKNQLSDTAPKVESKEVVETPIVETPVVETPVVESPIVEKVALVKIKVLIALAGKFLLPYNPDAEIEIDANQAAEIVEAGYGEYINE